MAIFHFRLKSDKKPSGSKVSAVKNGFRLPTLSERTMVYPKSNRIDVLLQADESNDLDEFSKECYQRVRWDFSSERVNFAQLTAKKILENMAQALKEHSALSHVEYINREKAFANRGGCIFHSHHLPKWAHDDPKNFFQAADEYEAVGNRRYREINELKTVEQYRQAFEQPLFRLRDTQQNRSNVRRTASSPCSHYDDVEKKQERDAKNFFLYPARKKKDGSEPSFEEKWKRGAPKARKWADKNFLSVLRADFAQIQNEVLERNGFSIRVEHRTLKAQKEEAERNGDIFLDRLFNRVPEKYVGINNEQLARLKESTRAKDLMDSKEYKTQNFVSQYLAAMKSKMLTAVAEVNKWKRVIISQHDAQEQTMLEYMTKAERELWQRYFESLA